MLTYLKKITSLKNLVKSDSLKGQTATLLTLALAAVLIIGVMMLNLGNVAVNANTLSNAADSASLLLASQISTQAYQLWDSLDGKPNNGYGTLEKCKKSSFLSLLFGAIFAIIVIVISFIFPPFGLVGIELFMFVMVAAAAAGAAGGAVGAMASGTDVLQGAAQGAAIGAALGGIACGAYAMTVATPAIFTSMAPVYGMISTGVMGLGSTLYKAMSEANAVDQGFSQAAKVLNGLPQRDIYRESVFLNVFSQTIDDPNRTDSKYVQLFEDTDCDGKKDTHYCVAKPGAGRKENCDPHDFNGNGDKDEAVPYFQYWWERRVDQLKKVIPELELMTQDFVSINQCPSGSGCTRTAYDYAGYCDNQQPLSDFQASAQAAFTTQYQGDCFVRFCDFTWTPGPLYRRTAGTAGGSDEWKEYLICPEESSACKDTLELPPENNGVVVQVAEALARIGKGVSFYKGTFSDSRYGEDCDGDCRDESHFDEMEAVIAELGGFADNVGALKGQSYQKLTSVWDSWIRMFYDPDTKDGDGEVIKNRDDYYDTLEVLVEGNREVKGVREWKEEIAEKKYRYGNSFPECIDSYRSSTVTNFPCRVGSGDCSSSAGCVITTDSNPDDDFARALLAIDKIIVDIAVYRSKSKNYYESMNRAYDSMDTDYGGLNPVTYQWADSRCPKDTGDLDKDGDKEETLPCHGLTIQVSNFKLPWVRQKKSGGFLTKKTCLILTDYQDNGTNTWVTVSREDLANQAIGGALGSWNYCGPKDPNCVVEEKFFNQNMFKTSRTSKAYYSHDKVGLASK